MELIEPTKDQLVEMMGWFTNEDELKDWAGPNFRFPYDLDSFTNDLSLDSLNSFSLLSDKSRFLAFGQYYLRLGRCHLGRLIVAPHYRGRGVAATFLSELSRHGMKRLGVSSLSLFVLSHNESAIKAYEKFGFRFVAYPEKMPLKNCLYMIKV